MFEKQLRISRRVNRSDVLVISASGAVVESGLQNK